MVSNYINVGIYGAELTDKIDRATDERAPRANSYGSFLLLQLNDPESYFQFYVIRAERKRAIKARDRIVSKHINATTAIEIDYQPNAMNLFTLIKEDLGKKGRKLIEENGNYITLSRNYNIDTFLSDVRHIEVSKKSVWIKFIFLFMTRFHTLKKGFNVIFYLNVKIRINILCHFHSRLIIERTEVPMSFLLFQRFVANLQ